MIFNPSLPLQAMRYILLWKWSIPTFWLGTTWNGVDVLSLDNDYTFNTSHNKGETPFRYSIYIKIKESATFIGLDGKTCFKENTSRLNIIIKPNHFQFNWEMIIFNTKKLKWNTLWNFVNGLVTNMRPWVLQFQTSNRKPKIFEIHYNDVALRCERKIIFGCFPSRRRTKLL
jgi:hypothetical protein